MFTFFWGLFGWRGIRVPVRVLGVFRCFFV
jgi:hypothetical protein